MKTKFKYVTLVATALLLGFSSCSNDETDTKTDDSTPKSVTVRISAPSTYAEEATAVGKTPDINDVNVYFVGGGVVKATGTMTAAEIAGSGKTFNDVPGSATKVVIIANAATLSSPDVSSIAVNSSENALNALMFEQSKQTNPTTAVNVYGSATITGVSGSETAAVTLKPAISRIEIAKVEVDPSATIALTGFKLAGIYINNTYTQCGTDYSTLPTAAADILNYDGTNAIWTSGSYPARFSDEWSSPTTGTSFAPTSPLKWSYYVMPVIASKGTTINTVAQSAVPHIVLKIVDAQATGYGFASTSYVTVKEIKVGGVALTQLERGKVYSIASIKIGGGNLASTPETPTEQNVTVTATVTDWLDEPVEPVL